MAGLYFEAAGLEPQNAFGPPFCAFLQAECLTFQKCDQIFLFFEPITRPNQDVPKRAGSLGSGLGPVWRSQGWTLAFPVIRGTGGLAAYRGSLHMPSKCPFLAIAIRALIRYRFLTRIHATDPSQSPRPSQKA